MDILYILLLLAAAFQIGIFVMNRRKKKGPVIPDILTKYNIKTRGDLFQLINNHQIPEEDRLLLEKHYQQTH